MNLIRFKRGYQLETLCNIICFAGIVLRSPGAAFQKKDPASDGVIYIYRVPHAAGVMLTATVTIDDQNGSLAIGQYIVRAVKPGMHQVGVVLGMLKASYSFDVKSGTSCYVREAGSSLTHTCGDEVPAELAGSKRSGQE